MISEYFLQNKYTQWYYSIINKQRFNQPIGYSEKHHIVPRSIGGDDFSSNIVRLTPRAHFICHRLLIRMLTGKNKYKMIHALWMMSQELRRDRGCRLTSKSYAWLKEQKSNSMQGNQWAIGKRSPEFIEQNRQTQRVAQMRPEVRAQKAATWAKPETKAHARAMQQEAWARPGARDKARIKRSEPIAQVDRKSGTIVNVFPSGKEAERATGISRSHISSTIHGKRSHAGGFVWQALEEEFSA